MFAVEGNLSQVRLNLGIVLRAVGMSTELAVWDTRAVGHDGCGSLPCLWGGLHLGPAQARRWQDGKGLSMKHLYIPACQSSQKSHGKRSLSSNLGWSLSSKREQGDESESALLLHTFIQDGSLF